MKTIRIAEGAVETQIEVHTFGKGRPRVFFTAGIHGNEVSGIYVAEKLIDDVGKNPPEKGQISVIPRVNKTAMRCRKRTSPFDNEDLNRVFPGDSAGSFTRRLAADVYEATEKADIIVDLHCCGQHGMPYILSIYSESEKAKNLVSEITMPIAVHSEGTDGQLFTESCRRRGQAACIIEIPSGPSAGTVNLPVAEQVFEALLDMLRAEGVLKGRKKGKKPTFYGKLLDLNAPAEGLWKPVHEKGDFVPAGDVLGSVGGQDVRMPEDGLLMNLQPCGYLFPDDLCVGFYAAEECAF